MEAIRRQITHIQRSYVCRQASVQVRLGLLFRSNVARYLRGGGVSENYNITVIDGCKTFVGNVAIEFRIINNIIIRPSDDELKSIKSAGVFFRLRDYS